jgi:hypothetical protein
VTVCLVLIILTSSPTSWEDGEKITEENVAFDISRTSRLQLRDSRIIAKDLKKIRNALVLAQKKNKRKPQPSPNMLSRNLNK